MCLCVGTCTWYAQKGDCISWIWSHRSPSHGTCDTGPGVWAQILFTVELPFQLMESYCFVSFIFMEIKLKTFHMLGSTTELQPQSVWKIFKRGLRATLTKQEESLHLTQRTADFNLRDSNSVYWVPIIVLKWNRNVIICLFILGFRGRVSPYSPGCSGTL